MKRAAKNLSEGISLSNKVFLLAIFGLLTLVISPGLVRAIPLDITPIDSIEQKPFFKERGFLINNIKAPNFGGKYWLEKQELTKQYEINISAGYTTNLQNGLYPIMLSASPKDLTRYYKLDLGLSDEYIKEIIGGTEPFAYIKIVGNQARLVRNKKINTEFLDEASQDSQDLDLDLDSDRLTVNQNFPMGDYSFLLLNKDNSTQLANWQFRVVNHPAEDIYAVDTIYNSLRLGNRIYQDIILPTKIDNVIITWTSSNPAVITSGGIVTRPDIEDMPVTLTARILSGKFSRDKVFQLVVIKNGPYLVINGFTANGKEMKEKDEQYFLLLKENGVKNYLIDFNDGYKTNLQNGNYAIRFNGLSSELKDKLIKYYSSEGISSREAQLIIDGKEPCAYIQVINKNLRLIRPKQSDLSVGGNLMIDNSQINSLVVGADYPEGVYQLAADFDGGGIKLRLEVIDLGLQADFDNLSLGSEPIMITEDLDLELEGANGSVISWQSSDTDVITNNGQVIRPSFEDGDKTIELVATLSKGFDNKTKIFTVKVLKNNQVITPPTTGGGGGIASSVISQSINAINFPLSLISSQDGILTHSFANGFTARLAVSPNSFTGNAVFRIAEGSEENAIGGRHFALTATDSNGNPIRKFTNNLNITFSGLPLPGNVSGLGVYYYDEALLSWILVPDAIFDQANGLVSFSVDHLTNFAIFSEQPVTQQVLGEATYADGTLLRGSDKHIFVVIGGKLKRILNLKELAQYADQEILEVEDSVIAAYAKVSSKAVLGVRKYNFSRDLKTGVISDDVQELQRYLNDNGYIVSKTGPGSIGQETKKFGRATREALIKFQKDNKISPAVGYFGPLTRQVVNR